MTYDPYRIIPVAAKGGLAVVKPLDFQLRVLAEFDVNTLRDRIRADIFVNDNPVGAYAIAHVDERSFPGDRASLAEAIEHYGPHLERAALDALMGHSYRRRVDDLELQTQHLKELVEHLCTPRWRRLARRVKAWWDSLPQDGNDFSALEHEVR